MLTDHLPRVSLAHLPTPLEAMPRLRQALGGGPRLLIKRDDQTGLATGGNKTRKLEFLAAEALAQGADTLLTVGGPQSNHCRQTAAAAASLGLRCVLLLGGAPLPRAQWNGNLLLNELLGAEMRWLDGRQRAKALQQTAQDLRAAGARPYLIPLGGSTPRGAVGYVAAVQELAAQCERLDHIVLASGSGGTHAGVLVGVKALGWGASVVGMNNLAVSGLEAALKALVVDTAAFLGLELDFADTDFILRNAGAHAYGVITAAEREAIRLLARTEGILADPVYTGRALAGLIEQIRQGVYSSDESVLFWHTGGAAGLFGRASELLDDS